MEPTLRIPEAVQRLKGMFLEIPGTQLSLAQAAQLTGMERSFCQAVLSALEDVQFLKRTHDGLYRRRTSDTPNS
jgi:hypothetical protein